MLSWAANLAIRVAKTSKYPQFKHGAVVVSGGRHIASDVNKFRPFNPKTSCSVHAEVAALKKYSRSNVKTVDLYVARVTNRSVRGSKPCLNCQEYIHKIGTVANVYYTTREGNWAVL